MASTSIFERLACEAKGRFILSCNPARLPFPRHYGRLQNLLVERPYIQLGLDWRYWGFYILGRHGYADDNDGVFEGDFCIIILFLFVLSWGEVLVDEWVDVRYQAHE
jgi:hypothetical protein